MELVPHPGTPPDRRFYPEEYAAWHVALMAWKAALEAGNAGPGLG